MRLSEGHPEVIQSVQRIFELLEHIGSKPTGVRLSDLAEKADLRRSTAHNLLATVVALGYVTQTSSGGRYVLTDKFSELARGCFDGDDVLREELHPHLRAVASKVGETCYLGVPCGLHYVCIDVVEAQAPLRLSLVIGSRAPLLGTAIGHILLATRPDTARWVEEHDGDAWREHRDTIQRTRRDGYALDLDQACTDISCVALPIHRNGAVRAAIGVAGPTSRLPEERLIHLAHEVQRILPSAYFAALPQALMGSRTVSASQ